MKGDSFRGLRVRLVLLVLLAVIPSLLLIIYTARVERLLSTQLAHSSLSQVASLAASRTS